MPCSLLIIIFCKQLFTSLDEQSMPLYIELDRYFILSGNYYRTLVIVQSGSVAPMPLAEMITRQLDFYTSLIVFFKEANGMHLQ